MLTSTGAFCSAAGAAGAGEGGVGVGGADAEEGYAGVVDAACDVGAGCVGGASAGQSSAHGCGCLLGWRRCWSEASACSSALRATWAALEAGAGGRGVAGALAVGECANLNEGVLVEQHFFAEAEKNGFRGLCVCVEAEATAGIFGLCGGCAGRPRGLTRRERASEGVRGAAAGADRRRRRRRRWRRRLRRRRCARRARRARRRRRRGRRRAWRAGARGAGKHGAGERGPEVAQERQTERVARRAR